MGRIYNTEFDTLTTDGMLFWFGLTISMPVKNGEKAVGTVGWVSPVDFFWLVFFFFEAGGREGWSAGGNSFVFPNT